MVLPPKKPSYPNLWVTEVVQPTPNGTTNLPLDEQFYFPDATTIQTLIWQVNEQQWQQVFNALMYASDNAYPNRAIDTIEIFLRSVTAMPDLCDLVADCIETNPDIATALADLILNNSTIQSALQQIIQQNNQSGSSPYTQMPLPASVMANNIIPASALCTDGNKYAMSRAIVQELDRLTVDFLEIIELITNPAEIGTELVQAIPIFGGIASLAIDAGAWLQDNIKESYDAAYNSTTEIAYSCAIYCAFTDCELSWDDVIAAYEDEGVISPPASNDFVTVLTWLITNIIPSTDNLIVGAMHYFILSCLKWGSSWVGSGVFTTLEIAVEDAADEEITVPSECACTTLDVAVFDFSVNDGGFQNGSALGVSGKGIYSGGAWVGETNVSFTRLYMFKDLPAGCNVTEIGVIWDRVSTATNWSYSSRMRDTPSSASGQVTLYSSSGTASTNGCFTGSIAETHRNWIFAAFDYTNIQDIRVTEVRIRFTGTPPTGYTSLESGNICV